MLWYTSLAQPFLFTSFHKFGLIFWFCIDILAGETWVGRGAHHKLTTWDGIWRKMKDEQFEERWKKHGDNTQYIHVFHVCIYYIINKILSKPIGKSVALHAFQIMLKQERIFLIFEKFFLTKNIKERVKRFPAGCQY